MNRTQRREEAKEAYYGSPEARKRASDAQMLAEKEALVARVHGPWKNVFDAIPSDREFQARVRKAADEGMPVPEHLSGVPLYRRPEIIQAALKLWERSTANGPCAYCGVTTARRGLSPSTVLPSRDPKTFPSPTFTTAGSPPRPSCEWCKDFITEHGEEELAQAAYAATVGLRGVGDTTRRVMFAYQITRALPRNREPWSHLDPVALTRDAIKHYYWNEFADAPWQLFKVDGITSPVGRPDLALFKQPQRTQQDVYDDDLAAAQAKRRADDWAQEMERQRQFDENKRRKVEAEAARLKAERDTLTPEQKRARELMMFKQIEAEHKLEPQRQQGYARVHQQQAAIQRRAAGLRANKVADDLDAAARRAAGV